MNLDLESAKKVLKIFGIITLILGVLGLLLGILMFTGGNAVAGSQQAAADAEIQKGTIVFMGLGIVTIVSGIISIIDGFCSIKASKDSKYGLVAMIFAVIGLLSQLYSGIRTISNGSTWSGILSIIAGLAVNGCMVYAANLVRLDYMNSKG